MLALILGALLHHQAARPASDPYQPKPAVCYQHPTAPQCPKAAIR